MLWGFQTRLFLRITTVVLPLLEGCTFQDPPQWMLKTPDSTEPYLYHDFSYTYVPMTKFNL